MKYSTTITEHRSLLIIIGRSATFATPFVVSLSMMRWQLRFFNNTLYYDLDQTYNICMPIKVGSILRYLQKYKAVKRLTSYNNGRLQQNKTTFPNLRVMRLLSCSFFLVILILIRLSSNTLQCYYIDSRNTLHIAKVPTCKMRGFNVVLVCAYIDMINRYFKVKCERAFKIHLTVDYFT